MKHQKQKLTFDTRNPNTWTNCTNSVDPNVFLISGNKIFDGTFWPFSVHWNSLLRTVEYPNDLEHFVPTAERRKMKMFCCFNKTQNKKSSRFNHRRRTFTFHSMEIERSN